MSGLPQSTRTYGPHAEQVAELWLPAGGEPPHPAVVLIHGGCWRAQYGRDLEYRVAADLTAARPRRLERRVPQARLRRRLARAAR